MLVVYYTKNFEIGNIYCKNIQWQAYIFLTKVTSLSLRYFFIYTDNKGNYHIVVLSFYTEQKCASHTLASKH